MDIVMAIRVSKDHISLLKVLITNMFSLYEKVFPDVKPINKFHHIQHYAEAIKQHGPSPGWSGIRFESAHNKAKYIARISYNFINVAKTVANHFSTCFAADMTREDLFLSVKVDIGPFKSVP